MPLTNPASRGNAPELGNGEFFKWSDLRTQLALYANVFMAEKVSQGGADTMGVPGRVAGCSNTSWSGSVRANYPARLPARFTVTRDRAVWDNAVSDWLGRHPGVAP